MPKKKGKKGTPEELDFIFARKLISEDDYGEFWKRWFDSSKREQSEIIEEYTEKVSGGYVEGPELPLKGIITKNRKLAENQAKSINGYIVRRDRTGKFARRGRYYQAVKRHGKKQPVQKSKRKRGRR